MPSSSPSPDQALFEQVRLLEYGRRPDQALALLDKTIASSPTALAYGLRCQVLVGMDKADRAIGDCRQALKMDPNLALAHESLGDAFYNSGRIPDAIPEYTAFIGEQPGNGLAYWRRCDAYRRTNQAAPAIADCTKAAQLSPDNPYVLLSLARLDLNANDNTAALQTLNKALALMPGNVNLLYWRGYAALQLKDYQAAVADFSSAIADGDKAPDTYRDRFKAYAGLNDETNAERDWRMAVQLYRANGMCKEANDTAILGMMLLHVNKIDAEVCKPQ